MKKHIVLILCTMLVVFVLTVTACTEGNNEIDTAVDTELSTEVSTETEKITEADTEEPISTDTLTETDTDAVTEAPTEAATEIQTEAATETEPQETLEVDLSTVSISSSLDLFESHFTTADKESCVDDLVDVFGDPAIADGVKIPLVYQGAINLGEIDLSKFSKVTVTYATSASPATQTDYETTAKRALLTSADSKGQISPAEATVLASSIYYLPSTTWQLTTVEIDVSALDYCGNVYLTFDFTEGVNLYHAVTGVLFE